MPQSVVMNVFCNNVNRCREVNDISITELASRCGVLRPNLSKILSGGEGVSLDRASRIAAALGVPLSELVSPNYEPKHVAREAVA